MFSSKDLFFTPASTGYTVSKSLRFRASASAYLNRTPASASNQQKWTWSGWVKRGSLSSYQMLFVAGSGSTNYCNFYFDQTADRLEFFNTNAAANSGYFLTTGISYRDPSAWYHLILAVDTTASAGSRAKLYVNGSQVNWTVNTDMALNYNTWVNSANTHQLCRDLSGASQYLDGYLAEVNFIDGQALTPSSFGAFDTNGVWQPARYTGSYGTNGFYLPFTNTTSTTTLVADSSGNGNNWTPNNISLTAGATYDSMLDSPTNAAGDIGNYCTWNPVYKNATVAATDGNLSANSGATSSTHRMIFGTLGFTTASYFEITTSGGSTTMVSIVGAGQATTGTADGVYVGSFSKSFGLGYATNAASWYATGATNANGAATNLVDGTWGFAVDPANGKAWVRNTSGSWIGGGDPAAGTLPTFTWTSDGLPWFPVMSFYNIATTFVGILNAGQRSYAFTAPSGFSALNTQNLTTPTITNGAQYMAATTWTGNGTSQTINNGANTTTGTTFQPDFIWIKSRGSAYNHFLSDINRGITTNYLFSDLTSAEAAAANVVTAVSSTGFSVGNAVQANENLKGIVGWQWKAGGTGVSNTSGSIPSTVSANTTAGFSVVTYTGTGANATVGHGLGVAPSMVIIKSRSAADWYVGHTSIGWSNTGYLILNNTGASGQYGSVAVWQSTAPNSTVITLGTASGVNAATGLVAYCFAPVAGYSAFGSYTGNGSTDGVFVYTGMRPRYLFMKRTDSAGTSWWQVDSSCNPYNVTSGGLTLNTSDAESSGNTWCDFLSNGFKIRTSSVGVNASGGTYIYAAFAENPFKISRAR